MPAIQAITAMTCSAFIQSRWSVRNISTASFPIGTRFEFTGAETAARTAGYAATFVCARDEIGKRGDEFRLRAHRWHPQIVDHAACPGKVCVFDIEFDER